MADFSTVHGAVLELVMQKYHCHPEDVTINETAIHNILSVYQLYTELRKEDDDLQGGMELGPSENSVRFIMSSLYFSFTGLTKNLLCAQQFNHIVASTEDGEHALLSFYVNDVYRRKEPC